MRKKINIYVFIITNIALFGCSSLQEVRTLKEYPIFTNKVTSEEKLIDVVIIHAKNSRVKYGNLKKQFLVAQETFKTQGIYLNLLRSIKVELPKHWHKVDVDELLGKQLNGHDFYKEIELKKKKLSNKAVRIFSKIIEDFQNKDKTIFLITLNDISMGIFDNGKVKNFKVGGYSFPSYIYQDRIPKELKGIITLGRNSKTHSMIAHELAHKLVNATHEGGNSCPKFSGKKIPGILGYTGSTQILDGIKGRWHGERLKLSPFAYRLIKGQKVWNPDYKKDGIYSDPIYGKYVISPVCPD